MYIFSRSNVLGIVKLRDFALITPEQYHLTVKHLLEFHTRMIKIYFINVYFYYILIRSIWLCKNNRFII